MKEDSRDLRRQADQKLGEAEQIINRAKQEKRNFTDSENREMDALVAEHDALMDRADRIDGRDPHKWVGGIAERRSVGEQSLNDPPKMTPSGGNRSAITQRGVYSGGREERKFERMFGSKGRNGGWASFDDFLRSVVSGNDTRLGEWQRRTMQEGIDSSGGFAVPEQWASEVWNESLESEVVRPLARIYSMKTDTLHVPALEIGDHSADRHGGVVSYWKGEGSSLTEKQPGFREVKLTAHKLTAYGRASSEILNDGLSFGEVIGRSFIEELHWNMDLAFIRGDGAGKPLGLLESACAIEQAKEGGQTASTVDPANIFKMWSRMHPAGAKRAVWIVHPSVLPELYGMGLAVGTGGSAVFIAGGTIANQPHNTMMGRPIVVSEKASYLGSAADIILFDPQSYAIGMRAEIQLAGSEHTHFSTDEVAIRGIVRVDGQCLWNEALTLRDGTHTVSPIVYLAARS